MHIVKHFSAWIRLKEKLHHNAARPPQVSEGEIWWISVDENVGSEINGKSLLFSRPAVVFRKLAHGFYFVIPTTTRIREGSWYVPLRQQGKDMVACLHQARAIDHRRLSTRLGALDDEDVARLREGFTRLYCTPK